MIFEILGAMAIIAFVVFFVSIVLYWAGKKDFMELAGLVFMGVLILWGIIGVIVT